MKSLVGKSKNKLKQIIKEMQKAIKLNCYDCMGGHKKLDCQKEDYYCFLAPYRPWAKNNEN